MSVSVKCDERECKCLFVCASIQLRKIRQQANFGGNGASETVGLQAPVRLSDNNVSRPSKAKQTDFQTSLEEIPTFFIHWNRRKTRAAKRRDEAKLNKYLMVRTKLDTLQIVSY